MKIYHVLANPRRACQHTQPIIDGWHPWHLPSVKCSKCGWIPGKGSVVYPYIDPRKLPNRRVYRGINAVSNEELDLALEPIRTMLPPGVPLFAGASIGPFEGTHLSGILEDFYFYYSLHLVKRDVLEMLRSVGAIRLGATPAKIRPRREGADVDCMELHLVPRARLAVPRVQGIGQKYCDSCGFDQRSLPQPLIVRKDSIVDQEEVCQLVDEPGVRLAQERFVTAVKSLNLSGIDFEPVEIV